MFVQKEEEKIKMIVLPESLTIQELAEKMKIQPSVIVKKLFMQKFKVSPKRYVVTLKMNYASELLKYGVHSVSKISEMCGYTDIYAFSHQFKKEFGLSPSEFVKKYVSSK